MNPYPITFAGTPGGIRGSRKRASRVLGFSLIELMVGLVLAVILLLGLATFFVSSSRSLSEAERVSRQIESGRYASALLSEDVRHAGFYGEVSNVINLPTTPAPASAIPLPGALPNPCATAIASVHDAASVPIQGVDAPDAAPSCVTDSLTGTDILVVRRANTTTVTAAVADAAANGYYTQTGNCATTAPIFLIKQSGASPSNFSLTGKDCATVMPVRQYHVFIYYIAPCSVATGSGGTCQSSDAPLPTLKRVELVAGAMSNPVPLVEGIENMQIEYGLDTSGDGSPDSFTAKPTTMTQWSQVVALRIHLLARNSDITQGFTDTKTYTLGLKADGTANSVTPGGSFRRHNYTELVRVNNVSQRLEATFP